MSRDPPLHRRDTGLQVVAKLPEQSLRSKVTVLREDPPSGQKAQIDYGYLGS